MSYNGRKWEHGGLQLVDKINKKNLNYPLLVVRIISQTTKPDILHPHQHQDSLCRGFDMTAPPA